MFERFTERARQVVVLAQQSARDLQHEYIGTEHLLAGLCREEEGLASRVLASKDITAEMVMKRIEEIVGKGAAGGVKEVAPGTATSGQQVPFTPRAKRCLELALREALSLGHNYIGTEHILLGLVREGQGVAMQMLSESLDGDRDAVAAIIRTEVIRMLSGPREAKVLAEVVTAEVVRAINMGDVNGNLRLAIAEMVGAITQTTQALGRNPDELSMVKTFTTDADSRLEKALGALRRARLCADE